MAKKKEYFTAEQVEVALRQSGAIYTLAAKILTKMNGRPCVPNTVKNYIKRYKGLAKVEQEVRDGTLDMAESKLISKIKDGNLTAVIFYLKTKGKDRGYVERGEVTGSSGSPLMPGILRIGPESKSSEAWAKQSAPQS